MPCGAGSVSRGTSGRNSAKQLGQPFVKISGIPRPPRARSCTKCTRTPEVTEPVQPAFLRAPVEAVRPVPQQVPQVTEVCALLPLRAWRRPWPPGVPDPRTQVGQDLVTHADAELLRPEGSHPASL